MFSNGSTTYKYNDHIVIEVADNGCGIPKEHVQGIYTPVFALKNTKDTSGAYDRSIKGTGYGLYNVKKIIEKHKGHIRFESQVNEGTQYYMLTRDPFFHHVDIAHNGHMAKDLIPTKFQGVNLLEYSVFFFYTDNNTQKEVKFVFVNSLFLNRVCNNLDKVFYKLKQKAIEGCADPIVVYDKNGMAVYLNPAFERVFGWSAKELMGKRIDFVPDHSMEQTQDAVRQVLNGKAVLGMETLRKTKEGKNIHVRLSANAIRGEGSQFDGIVVTLQDISELIQSRQEALQANQMKNNFLSNISHEVRTPMNGLMGILDLLEDTRLNDEQQEYLYSLQKSATALMTVINDILDFSKIESGSIECSLIDFDLRTVMDAVDQEIRKKTEKKGISLLISVHQQVPSLLKGDPEKVRQILSHLLDNAVKFSEKGRIDVFVILKEESKTHVILEFEISDTGIGIEPDKLKVIFESFSQGDNSTTRKFGGLGIGLSLSSSLIHLLGGHIGVQSTPGKGSVFTISMKIEKQQRSLEEQLCRSKSIAGKKILIVDSDDAGRIILKSMLKKWNCLFDEAATPVRALEKMASARKMQHPFDVVLIDMQMQEIIAKNLGVQIRSHGGLEPLIIMLSARGKPGDVDLLKKTGVQGYLPKPVNAILLFECITTAFALRRLGKEQVITRHFLLENRKQQVRILLMDVESTNNKILKNILNMSGFSVDIANNGIAGIEKFKTGLFNIILISIDPMINESIQTISILRELENEKKIGKIIIIGMIQNANTKDDLFRVDEYLLKPVTAQSLLTMINEWINRLHENVKIPGQYPGILKSGNKSGVFNYKSAFERAMDDKSFLKMILKEFIKSLPQKLGNIHTALEAKDSGGLSLMSHSIRGSSSSVGAERICSRAQELEKASDIGDFVQVVIVMKQLEDECHEFEIHINNIDWGDV